MDKIIILDNGSQYTNLIAKVVRKYNVYCEVVTHLHQNETQKWKNVKGLILSGGPSDLTKEQIINTIELDTIQCPILGICYGAQYIAHYYGANIIKNKSEYGKTKIYISDADACSLLTDMENDTLDVWMSHSNSIVENEKSMNILSRTQNENIAAYKIKDKTIYGLLFHPEVSHTEHGEEILHRFIQLCNCKKEWVPSHIVDTLVSRTKKIVGDDERVLMAVSGGVDSTVAATIIHKAVGNRLLSVFIDNGLLRKNEYEQVLDTYQKMNLNVIGINAKNIFIQRLKNVKDPEEKRKIIGKTFIDVFTNYCKNLSEPYAFLGQGTIYSDVIESSHSSHCSRKIKAHHNVGGLPEELGFNIVEPLRYLFKDEVRMIGKSLKISNTIIGRHPFPGPGLAIRIIGTITNRKITMLQEADSIFIRMLQERDIYNKIWQAAVILLDTKTVGVMGDERTYNHVVALRAICSTEGMTANIYPFAMDFLEEVSNEIINNVNGINRVVYDISSKPPATIEWE